MSSDAWRLLCSQVPTVMPVVYLVFNLSVAVAAITLETSRYVVPLLLVLSGIPLYFLSSSALFTAGPVRNFYGEP